MLQTWILQIAFDLGGRWSEKLISLTRKGFEDGIILSLFFQGIAFKHWAYKLFCKLPSKKNPIDLFSWWTSMSSHDLRLLKSLIFRWIIFSGLNLPSVTSEQGRRGNWFLLYSGSFKRNSGRIVHFDQFIQLVDVAIPVSIQIDILTSYTNI